MHKPRPPHRPRPRPRPQTRPAPGHTPAGHAPVARLPSQRGARVFDWHSADRGRAVSERPPANAASVSRKGKGKLSCVHPGPPPTLGSAGPQDPGDALLHLPPSKPCPTGGQRVLQGGTFGARGLFLSCFFWRRRARPLLTRFHHCPHMGFRHSSWLERLVWTSAMPWT